MLNPTTLAPPTLAEVLLATAEIVRECASERPRPQQIARVKEMVWEAAMSHSTGTGNPIDVAMDGLYVCLEHVRLKAVARQNSSN
jgi:hypothetical protein